MRFLVQHDFSKSQPAWKGDYSRIFGPQNEGFSIQAADAAGAKALVERAKSDGGHGLNSFYLMIAAIPGSQDDVEPTPFPRWTLAPGRTLCYDGKPVATLARVGNDADGFTCRPAELDDFAHTLVAMLDRGNILLGNGVTPGFSPLPFPIWGRLADEARAVTPVTLPTRAEGVARAYDVLVDGERQFRDTDLGAARAFFWVFEDEFPGCTVELVGPEGVIDFVDEAGERS